MRRRLFGQERALCMAKVLFEDRLLKMGYKEEELENLWNEYLKNSTNELQRDILTSYANICAIPLNYNTAKYEFILMLSQLYRGVP